MAVRIRLKRQAKRFHEMKCLRDDGKIRNGEVYINVTALVDMMTVLVIFLVMQFNATGEMLFISKDLKMPGAEHALEITRVPIISLSRTGDLYFEGSVISNQIVAPKSPDEWKIEELAEKLLDNRRRFEAIGADRSKDIAPEEDPVATVNLQVDQEVDYAIVKRVLYTCESAGYSRIRFAVGDERKSEPPKEIRL